MSSDLKSYTEQPWDLIKADMKQSWVLIKSYTKQPWVLINADMQQP